jgi:hypothetical protein
MIPPTKMLSHCASTHFQQAKFFENWFEPLEIFKGQQLWCLRATTALPGPQQWKRTEFFTQGLIERVMVKARDPSYYHALGTTPSIYDLQAIQAMKAIATQ